MPETITISRAPVLTLWAAVVAQRHGFTWEEALSLGRAVAGLNAYKGRRATLACSDQRLRLSVARFTRTGGRTPRGRGVALNLVELLRHFDEALAVVSGPTKSRQMR